MLRPLALAATVVLAASGCSHERQAVARAASCEAVTLVASSEGRAPTDPTAPDSDRELAAVLRVLLTVASVGAQVAAPSPLPAAAGSSVSARAPGWRHYEGCGVAVTCFDGGDCSKVTSESDVGVARELPSLMKRSAETLGPALTARACADPAVHADRRGALVWTVAACGRAVGCQAQAGATVACFDAEGRAVGTPLATSR